jgi:acetoin utilization protein AcuB
MITVADIMTADPIVVNPDIALAEAIGVMKTQNCRHIPVTEAGKLVGIITDRDVRLAMNSPMVLRERADDIALLNNVTVGVTMTPNPMIVKPDDPATKAAKLMRVYKFGALPVVEEGRLVGIVTDSDVLDSYITMLESLARTPRS